MINRIAHIALALLFFISTNGFVINKHFCQNELKDTALFVKAQACHNPQVKKGCPMHSPQEEDHQEDENKKDCCDDKTEYFKIDEEQLIPSTELNIQHHTALFGVIFVIFNLEFPSFDTQSLQYFNYKPPLIVCDRPLRFQTFLC